MNLTRRYDAQRKMWLVECGSSVILTTRDFPTVEQMQAALNEHRNRIAPKPKQESGDDLPR